VNGDDRVGDHGLDWLLRGELKKKTLVATVMSNLALTTPSAPRRTSSHRRRDRYVIERMLADDLNVGGDNRAT